MNKDLEKLKVLYDNIDVSPNLDDVIQNAFSKKRNRKVIYMKKTNKIIKTIGTVAACGLFTIGALTNISSSFANAIYSVPGIGDFAKLVTFRNYSFENETSIAKINIPEVEVDTNKDIQDKINKIIQDKIDYILEEQAILDEEYKEAYLETGGTEETYRKIETTVDYKIGYSDDKVISFEVYKYQTLAAAYNENFYYNYNLETGDEIKLSTLLGEDFSSIIKEKVLAEMQNRMEADSNKIYDIDYFNEMTIDDSRTFYIDKDGNIVVTFAKYEVACGAMGLQEFIVGNIK